MLKKQQRENFWYRINRRLLVSKLFSLREGMKKRGLFSYVGLRDSALVKLISALHTNSNYEHHGSFLSLALHTIYSLQIFLPTKVWEMCLILMRYSNSIIQPFKHENVPLLPASLFPKDQVVPLGVQQTFSPFSGLQNPPVLGLFSYDTKFPIPCLCMLRKFELLHLYCVFNQHGRGQNPADRISQHQTNEVPELSASSGSFSTLPAPVPRNSSVLEI